MQTTTQRSHLLDILKGISIILVIITHAKWSKAEHLYFGFPFWVGMAVPVFLLISGYVGAQSLERKMPDGLSSIYTKPYLMKSFIRYSVPLLFIYVAECIYKYLVGAFPTKRGVVHEAIYRFMRGGWGPGSYYYPLLLQFVVVMPIVYRVIRIYKGKGLLYCFLVNLLYEICKVPYALTEGLYRLLIFRYLFVIACGAYFALEKKKPAIKQDLPPFLVGVGFLIVTQYFNYKPVFFSWWRATSMFAVLYIIPIFHVLLYKAGGIRCRLMEKIGTSTYNIFLLQMLYYHCLQKYIAVYMPNRWVLLGVNILICVSGGILLTRAEKPLLGYFNRFYAQKNDRRIV